MFIILVQIHYVILIFKLQDHNSLIMFSEHVHFIANTQMLFIRL